MAEIEQVFISHDSEDTQFAHRLAGDLQQLGVQVWIAPESIDPGESWLPNIERGLVESGHVRCAYRSCCRPSGSTWNIGFRVGACPAQL